MAVRRAGVTANATEKMDRRVKSGHEGEGKRWRPAVTGTPTAYGPDPLQLANQERP
jgi:hypothetical protein